MKWMNKGHEFDSIGHLLDGKDQIYIYGAKKTGEAFCQAIIQFLKLINWKIIFIDTDIGKQKTGFLGFDVKSPAILKNLDKAKSFVVVCACEENTPEMMQTAESAGFIRMNNLFDYYYFIYTYLSVYFLYHLDMVYIPSLNMVPSTICNLNCKGCLNFNPLIKKHITYDLDFLFADVDALFSAIDMIGRFQITGGEPLLYPKLSELIAYIGSQYRKKIVNFELVTNGTIVPADCVCSSAKKYNMCILVDDYRENISNIKFEQVVNKFRSYDLRVLENYVSKWFDLMPNFNNPRQFTESELEDWYTTCENPWATIHNKSITACNYNHYAAKAGVVADIAADYFDLTKPFTKHELVEYRLRYNNRGYTELCKQCAKYRYNNHWISPAVQLTRNEMSL